MGETRALELIGGVLCLDFANSVGGLRGGVEEETLHDHGDFIEWSVAAGSLDADGAARARAAAQRDPSAAQQAFGRAIVLREAIYGVMSALAANRLPLPTDLQALNRELAIALAHARVVAEADGFAWGWDASRDALDAPLWPLARSAADLLTSQERRLIRECASTTCSWLFLDRTKNHRRRWCDMRGCGNRAKARRHRQRQRLSGAGNMASEGR